jgi:hypothetical protein
MDSHVIDWALADQEAKRQAGMYVLEGEGGQEAPGWYVATPAESVSGMGAGTVCHSRGGGS